jgi:hypothetical protein
MAFARSPLEVSCPDPHGLRLVFPRYLSYFSISFFLSSFLSFFLSFFKLFDLKLYATFPASTSGNAVGELALLEMMVTK